MKEKYAIVIDSQGRKVEFVLVEKTQVPVPADNGINMEKTETRDIPHGYTLQDGERLIFDGVSTALSMQKPRWNGHGWEETATDAEIEAVLPPLEDVRKAKIAELGMACETAIYAGIDVETSQGAEHFSLTINDQTNIANLAAQAQTGEMVLYHADGALCRPFWPEDMLAVAAKAIEHKTKHTTLCNHYNVWARRVQTREELTAIVYGCPLPSDLVASMDALLGAGSGDE